MYRSVFYFFVVYRSWFSINELLKWNVHRLSDSVSEENIILYDIVRCVFSCFILHQHSWNIFRYQRQYTFAVRTFQLPQSATISQNRIEMSAYFSIYVSSIEMSISEIVKHNLTVLHIVYNNVMTTVKLFHLLYGSLKGTNVHNIERYWSLKNEYDKLQYRKPYEII